MHADIHLFVNKLLLLFNIFCSSIVQSAGVFQDNSSRHTLAVDRHTASIWYADQVHKAHRTETKMTSDPSGHVWELKSKIVRDHFINTSKYANFLYLARWSPIFYKASGLGAYWRLGAL